MAGSAIAAATSCREPTQVRIEATTNVPFRPGVRTAFTVGGPGETEDADATTVASASWGSDGFVGSLAVVPGSANDAALSIKLVMGTDRDPRECSMARPAGCIFARRRLSYRPHEALVLPIVLYERCKGVPCTADTTCNYLGLCVASTIDPDTCGAAGCVLPGELPDGGAVGDAAMGPDAIGRADGKAPDASNDAGADGGTSPPQTVDCPPSRCAVGQQCCWNPNTGQGTCEALGDPCGSQPVVVRCDSRDDCNGGGAMCCAFPTGSVCSMSGCASMGPIMCAEDLECATSCTGVAYGHYRSCAP